MLFITRAGSRAYSNAYFGESVNKSINLNSIRCFGFENRLISCARGSNDANKDLSLEVGVKCEPGNPPSIIPEGINKLTCSTLH